MSGAIVTLLYGIATIAAVHFFRFFYLVKIPRWMVTGSFVLKLAASFVFYLVYTKYYTDPSVSDALRYFGDAQIIYHEWYNHPDVFWALMKGEHLNSDVYETVVQQLDAWSSGYTYGLNDDCSTIIRINVILSFVSFGSFHVHAMLLSFFAFTGFVLLFKAFMRYFEGKEMWLFVICFLMPSVVFWSSSVLKESALFFFMGLFFYALLRLIENWKQPKLMVLSLTCFYVLFYLKMYVVVSMLPAFLFLFFALIMKQRKLLILFVIVHLGCFFLAQNAHHFFRGGDFLYVLHKRQTDFYNVAYLTDAGSVIDVPPIGTVAQFVVHFPQAFFLTFFRPLPFELNTWPGLLFGLENFAYLIFILGVIFFRKKKIASQHQMIILFLLSFVLVFASILGNVVPILGAMIRYKVVALPFFLIMFAMIADQQKIKLIFLGKK